MKNFLMLLASLLLLSSCGMMPNTNTDISSMKSVDTTNNSVTSYTTDLDATSSKIKDSEEFQGCMKQNTNMCIQSSGMQIAQKTKDPNFCRELLTSDQQSNCEFTIIMINATEKGDDKICDTITDMNYQKQCKMQIYKQEAISKKDITLCDKLDDLTKPTGSGIMIDSGMQKDQCIMQYIMSGVNTDNKDCEALSNTGSFEMCKAMIKNRPTVGPLLPGESTNIPPVSPTIVPVPLPR